MNSVTSQAADTAHEVGARYGDDGQRFEDADGVWISDACETSGVQVDQNWGREMTRYTFDDGSVITVAGGGWDYGYADCWCWDGTGHSDECSEVAA